MSRNARIVFFLSILALSLTVFCFTTDDSSHAAAGDIYVDGVEIVHGYWIITDGHSEEGSASNYNVHYDSKIPNDLTIKDLDISHPHNGAGVYLNIDMDVTFRGDCSISGCTIGIYSSQDLTVDIEDSLEIESRVAESTGINIVTGKKLTIHSFGELMIGLNSAVNTGISANSLSMTPLVSGSASESGIVSIKALKCAINTESSIEISNTNLKCITTASNDDYWAIQCVNELVISHSDVTVEAKKNGIGVEENISILYSNLKVTANTGSAIDITANKSVDIDFSRCELLGGDYAVHIDGENFGLVDLSGHVSEDHVSAAVWLGDRSDNALRKVPMKSMSISSKYALIDTFATFVGSTEIYFSSPTDTRETVPGTNWSYDVKSRTLTLKNASLINAYEDGGVAYGIYSSGNLNIILDKYNRLQYPSLNYGIYSVRNISISGSGNLDLSADVGIYSSGSTDLRIADCSITYYGTNNDSSAVYSVNSRILVYGSEISVINTNRGLVSEYGSIYCDRSTLYFKEIHVFAFDSDDIYLGGKFAISVDQSARITSSVPEMGGPDSSYRASTLSDGSNLKPFVLRDIASYRYITTDTGAVVHVQEIFLDRYTGDVSKDKTLRLNVTIFPENATNKRVQWTSDNTDVAYVDQEGSVKGIHAGTALITATSEDGGKTAFCWITVLKLTISPVIEFQGGLNYFVYSGEKINPTIAVYYTNGPEQIYLTSNDFNPVYNNNINPGAATVTIQEIGNDYHFAVTPAPKNFTISSIDVSKSTISADYSELKTVPYGLRTLYSTPDGISEKLAHGVTSKLPKIVEKMLFYDMSMIVMKGTNKYVLTDASIPASGVQIKLTWDDLGLTKADGLVFSVAHMYDETLDGHYRAGDVEYPNVIKESDGVAFMVYAASPFMIGWSENNAPAPTMDIDFTLVGIIIGAVAAVALIGVLIHRRRAW